VEESAIAEELQKLARAEKEHVLPALAQARAYDLPIAPPLAEWTESLETILSSQSDDCVRMLAGEGRSLREQREKAQRIRTFLTEKNIAVVQTARTVLHNQVPLLERSAGESIPEAEEAIGLLNSDGLPGKIDWLAKFTSTIDSSYRSRFAERHHQRLEAYRQVIQAIREHPDFRAVEASEAEPVLSPLTRRATETFDLSTGAAVDSVSGATLASLEEDIELLPSLQAGALSRLGLLKDAKKGTEEAVEVIRLSDFLPRTQALTDFTDEEIDRALDQLREKLYNLRELKRRVLWD
jgi:hypothetical protein